MEQAKESEKREGRAKNEANRAQAKRSEAWTWIAALFAVETVGGIVAAFLIGIPLQEVALPIVVLLSGVAVSILLREAAEWSDKHHQRRSRAKRSRRTGVRWLPVGIYYLFIFFLSDRTYSAGTAPGGLFHPVEFTTLGLLLAWALESRFRHSGPRYVFAVLFAGSALGLLDEIHQLFVPGRYFSTIDLALDFAGLVMGIILFRIFIGIVRSRRSAPGKTTESHPMQQKHA